MEKNHLQLRLFRPGEWGAIVDPSSPQDLFCPADDPPAIGSWVSVEVQFERGPLFLLSGKVVWRRPHSDRRVRAGVGVALDPRHRATVDYINGWSSGMLAERRLHPRLPLRLRVVYRVGPRRRVNFTRDVSKGGIYIHSSQVAAIDDEISLSLAPPDAPQLQLAGRVRRCEETNQPFGMGIQLVFPEPAMAERYASLIVDLERRLLRGELPKELLPR
jgi:Tfp pilus assembly protein PilZ